METIITTIKIILLTGILYFYIKFGYKIILLAVYKFFNEKTKWEWDNLRDKPRVLLYFLSILTLYISFDDNIILYNILFKIFSLLTLIFTESTLFSKINTPSKSTIINKKKLLLFLEKYLISTEDNHINSINKIVNNQISEINSKTIVSEVSNKRELGRIFFQLIDLNFLTLNEVKYLYNKRIFRHKKIFLSSDDFHDHKKIFKNAKILYSKIDLKKCDIF